MSRLTGGNYINTFSKVEESTVASEFLSDFRHRKCYHFLSMQCVPAKKRNGGLERIRKLPKITQLVNAIVWNIQDSSSLSLKICIFPAMITKVTYMKLAERRKVKSGFNADRCFKDELLNIEVDLGRKS